MSLKERFYEVWDVARLRAALTETFPSSADRNALLAQMRKISANVECPHNESHVLSFIVPLFKLSPRVEGAIVEAGCFKGGSTAKLSLVASVLKRELIVFDSFEGLPENTETHDTSIFGYSIKGWFDKGKFSGGLEEVRSNVETYGDIRPVRFIKGWFENTMPLFDSKICAAYIDVDLASSTRTCLKYLYPRLSPGGILVSQDGDFPLVIDVFKDKAFWENEVGCPMPDIDGLGTKKILTIVKQGR